MHGTPAARRGLVAAVALGGFAVCVGLGVLGWGSASGFFAVTSAPLEIGTEVTCDVRMPAAGGLAGSTISTRAKIARRDDGGYGFSLVEPPQALIDAIAAYK